MPQEPGVSQTKARRLILPPVHSRGAKAQVLALSPIAFPEASLES